MASIENSEGFKKVQYKKKPTSSKYNEQDVNNLQRRIHSPKVDLIERGSEYLIRIELPGVSKETIRISIKDNQIVFISGSKQQIDNFETDKVIYRESKFDEFTRRVKLPSHVLKFNNVLDLSNGVLNLSFTKKNNIDKNKELPPPPSTKTINFTDFDKVTNWADME